MARMSRPIDAWPDVLEAACAACAHFTRVRVVRSTASTQDVAREAAVGSVIVAGRQTAGRGRQGRAWADTGDAGLAVSFTAPHAVHSWISLAAAIAAAEASEDACMDACETAPIVQLKFPNDLLVAGRKLGGVLVERTADQTIIGIGINCSQREFPAAIAQRATSLALQGFVVDRCDLACRLIARVDQWLHAEAERVASSFRARDSLRGRVVRFVTAAGMIEGLVVDVDPLRGIVVRTSRGDQVLPPEQTSVFVEEDRIGSVQAP
ncbi:MAG: biotin--[acetyl-CoA-carboxylase] ligase [Planctomycetes bacterium]|nr:biotin--[acetyl-CoA-carboxylase] ligase [Planctomycetota bacterium]